MARGHLLGCHVPFLPIVFMESSLDDNRVLHEFCESEGCVGIRGFVSRDGKYPSEVTQKAGVLQNVIFKFSFR